MSTAAVLQPQNKHQHHHHPRPHPFYRAASLWHRKNNLSLPLRDLQLPGFGSPNCISLRSSSAVRRDWYGWPMQSEDTKNYIQIKQNICWWSSFPLQESQRVLGSSGEPCERSQALAFLIFIETFNFKQSKGQPFCWQLPPTSSPVQGAALGTALFCAHSGKISYTHPNIISFIKPALPQQSH